jgi:hypothetical protein
LTTAQLATARTAANFERGSNQRTPCLRINQPTWNQEAWSQFSYIQHKKFATGSQVEKVSFWAELCGTKTHKSIDSIIVFDVLSG